LHGCMDAIGFVILDIVICDTAPAFFLDRCIVFCNL
jgi:hypothetical protein